MTPEIDKVGAAIVKGVCNPEAGDLAVEFGESELDSFLDEGVLKEIPVIKTIIACRKTWTAIHDQLFLRKVMKFLAACPNITKEEKETFARENLSDSKKAKNLGDTIVLILDKLDDLEKPAMVAKVFAVFIRGKISYEMFRRIAQAIDIGFIQDLKTFVLSKMFTEELLRSLYSNLVRTGLITLKGPRIPGEGGLTQIKYEISEMGQLFKDCMNE